LFYLQKYADDSMEKREIRIRERSTEMETEKAYEIHGSVKPGFELVKDAFIDNFRLRDELGAACCIYYHSEKVIDLWGGIRDKTNGQPWEEDTLVIVHSTTKGMAAMAVALAHSRRWLDFDEKVCSYWPEFAQKGKDRITVRQLLAHQSGIVALDEHVDKSIVADLDRLAGILARQKLEWEPGTRQGYASIVFGFYESELLRRIDPRHRTLGQFFQEEIATPLGLDFYIRLPKHIPNSQLATYQNFNPGKLLFNLNPSMPGKFMLSLFTPGSLVYRAAFKNPGVGVPFDEQTIYSREIEVPSHCGVGNARAIAHAYSVFATGGKELGLLDETLEQLKSPAIPSKRGFYDEFLKFSVPFSLGFQKPCILFPYSHPSSFGHPGSGGSFGWADPTTEVGYGYVTNRAGFYQGNDPRDIALRDAFHCCIGQTISMEGGL
jgi:CubicO group peptidase (beta-lactamase class C family)